MNRTTTNASDSRRAMYNSFRNYPIKYLNFIWSGRGSNNFFYKYIAPLEWKIEPFNYHTPALIQLENKQIT